MCRDIIRKVLRENPDGLTTRQIALTAWGDEKRQSSVATALPRMPDCYIDRWLKTAGADAPVWVAVAVPPHCPKPDRKERPTGLRPRGRPRKVAPMDARA